VERDDIQRGILPNPDVPPAGLTTYDAKDPDTTYPPIVPLRPPAGTPNVLVILLDDVGFGASSAFGGPCQTPNFERLAEAGLRYNRFHTTALCSPTRSALLTGRNHHSVGMGNIAELATSAPGNSSIWPNTAAPLAKILMLNGYSTAQFGKCHEVPVWETSPMGPYRQWPIGMGFEHFYGFIGGETNQWYPALYEGTTPVEPSRTPEEGYYLNDDLADHAIAWIRQQKALMPDKPFFAYFAPGATHAPHHVPKEWADRYKGRFDQGWDKVRQQTFARQKALGVVPADCDLTERSAGIPAWDDVDPALKPALARQMEVYAGYLENTDHHVGLLIDALEDLEILDDTLIYLIIGDNGAWRLTERSVIWFKNTSFSLTAEVTVPEEGAEGVIVAQGGVSGGLSLYAKDGKPTYCYNFFGLERSYVQGTRAIPPGTHQVRLEFAYDGGGLGKGGTATIHLDGEAVGEGRIDGPRPCSSPPTRPSTWATSSARR
jgi:arylsulfatase A-like enzyme